MNRYKYVNEGIIAKLITDDVNKMAELIQDFPQTWVRTHASYIVNQLFKWPYDYVRRTYDRPSYPNCAKYMLILFTFTDDQYVNVILRVLNIYMYSDTPSVDYQNKIIDILQTCVGKMKRQGPLYEKIPRCFNNIRPEHRTVDHCINDIVIMYTLELCNARYALYSRNYPPIFLKVISVLRPNIITNIIIEFIETNSNYRKNHHQHDIGGIITPVNCCLIYNDALNKTIFDHIEHSSVYPIVVKLMRCGYNMPNLYRYVRDRIQEIDAHTDDINGYTRTQVWKLLQNFD